MTLQKRIDAAIGDFHGRHPEWDTTITGHMVELSNRGRGPGLSVYVSTADGIGFEVELQEGDEVARTVGEVVH